ncbi:DMT family transporter [Dongia sp.]|uniref:DMT family transporter n=1 Tax=Dongia sp. TaxID=1977262 RepID=UPI0035AEB0DA
MTAGAPKHLSAAGAMFFMALGVLLFGVADASVKWLTSGYGTWQILAVGRMPALIVAIGLTWRATGSPFKVKTAHFRFHAMRSILIMLTGYTFFEGLRFLPLVDCIAIAFAAPLFVTALSGPLIGESVGFRRWMAVGVGFVGVVIALIAAPRSDGSFISHLNFGAVLVLISAFFYSLTLITLRRISGKDSSHNILFHTSTATLIVVCPLAAMDWHWPTGADWAVLLLQGGSSAVAQLCMIKAFRSGEASMLAPIEYTALIWAAFFGWSIWNEIPTLQTLAGAAIIIAANFYIAQREVHHARKKDIVPENPVLPE